MESDARMGATGRRVAQRPAGAVPRIWCSRAMVGVLVLVALCLMGSAGAAQAATVCGPAAARTLAKSDSARVYVSGSRAYACSRKRRSTRRLGGPDRIIRAWVAGDRAAVLRRAGTGQELSVYAIAFRTDTQRVRVAGRIERLRMIANGFAVFVAIPDRGEPYVAASRGGWRLPAPGLVVESLRFENGVIAFRAADGVHLHGVFAFVGPDRRLARAGGIELVVRGSVLGGELFLRLDSGAERPIGRVLSNCVSSQGCAGIDLVQLAGRFGAARTISTGPDRNDIWVDAHDLLAGTSREACRWELAARPNPFQLAPDGSVSCAPSALA